MTSKEMGKMLLTLGLSIRTFDILGKAVTICVTVMLTNRCMDDELL